MFIRPSKKSFNKRAIMLNSIRTGTIIYTEDGVRAKVDSVNRDMIKISCYPDNIKLKIDLEAVSRIENYNEQQAQYLMDEKIRKGRESLKKKRQEKEKSKKIKQNEKE